MRASSFLGLVVVTAVAVSSFACKDGGGGAGGGSTMSGEGGRGGKGGACPTMPEALFNLTIRAESGLLPDDLAIDVTWSAGKEPTFQLDDVSTWKTLDDGVNVVCDLDATTPTPVMIDALVCHLWTSGPTEVKVTAKGYTTYDTTEIPDDVDRCVQPFPSAIDITLSPELDAGT